MDLSADLQPLALVGYDACRFSVGAEEGFGNEATDPLKGNDGRMVHHFWLLQVCGLDAPVDPSKGAKRGWNRGNMHPHPNHFLEAALSFSRVPLGLGSTTFSGFGLRTSLLSGNKSGALIFTARPPPFPSSRERWRLGVRLSEMLGMRGAPRGNDREVFLGVSSDMIFILGCRNLKQILFWVCSGVKPGRRRQCHCHLVPACIRNLHLGM